MMNARATGHCSRRAFTLVEAVATMTIIAILAGASSRLIFSAADGYAAAATRAELVNAGSAAMERMAAELREIALRPATTPAEPYLDSVTAGSISWEGGTSLSLTGTTLQLTVGGSARTLAENVTTFGVQCYDESDLALGASLSGATCDPVRRVQVTLTMTKSGVTETLRTKVFLRCMMAGAAP